MRSHLKKHYRRMQGFMAFFIGGIVAVAGFFPAVIKSHPGTFLLVATGFALVYAFWFRRALRSDGISREELRSYVWSQPMIVTAQVVLILVIIIKGIRLAMSK
jgi:hypothetical protein